jgi:hypothetical protein
MHDGYRRAETTGWLGGRAAAAPDELGPTAGPNTSACGEAMRARSTGKRVWLRINVHGLIDKSPVPYRLQNRNGRDP